MRCKASSSLKKTKYLQEGYNLGKSDCGGIIMSVGMFKRVAGRLPEGKCI